MMIKLFFVPEANEKSYTFWHPLKLHPYGPDAERQRERKEAIISQCYEEILFNEPVEQFYEVLTSGGPPAGGARGSKGGSGASSKGSKQASFLKKQSDRSAELPYADRADNPYSQKTEGKELDRLNEAVKTVEKMVKEEVEKLREREKELADLKGGEMVKAK